MSAALAGVALLLAAFLPSRFSRAARRGLGALGALALLPAAGASGTWPFVLLAAAAAALATRLPLALAAAGAVLVGLRPDAWAPLAVALAGVAAAVAADALDAGVRSGRTGSTEWSRPTLAAGVLLALVLALADPGAVLSWSFGLGVGGERVLLPGVGLLLGGAFVAALAGILLLGGALLAPPSPGARQGGIAALGGAVVAATLGIGLALVRLASLGEDLRGSGARPLALLVGATVVVGLCLREVLAAGRDGAHEDRPAPAPVLAPALVLGAAVVAGVEGWWRDGTYATALTAAASGTALLGLAVLEAGPRLEVAGRVLFLSALVWLLVA